MIASPGPTPRLTQWLLAFLAVGVWGLLLRPFLPLPMATAAAAAPEQAATFDTLTVQRINVVDPDGKLRLIIANSARFPGAIIHGKEYPRDPDDTAGLLFFDAKGDETGGVALGKLRGDHIAGITFDCAYQSTDCARMWRQESPDGARWRAGFDVFDRRPYTGRVESTQGVHRIALADENQNAELVVSDPQGRPRIRIGVDAAGTPAIRMLSPDGQETYRAGK